MSKFQGQKGSRPRQRLTHDVLEVSLRMRIVLGNSILGQWAARSPTTPPARVMVAIKIRGEHLKEYSK